MRILNPQITRTLLVFGIANGVLLLFLSPLPVAAQNAGSSDQDLDIHLHAGADADAAKAGLPLYPGARLGRDKENKNSANLAFLTEAFGMKLVVANYDSDDAPAKVLAYYREKLRKYGKVLECHSSKLSNDIEAQSDSNDSGSKELKCNGDNSGKVTELKAGTEDNLHQVSVEPAETGKGSTFAIVYVYTRASGKGASDEH